MKDRTDSCLVDNEIGIGEALSEKFISEGSQVIAVGRRKDRLAAVVHRNGKDKVSAVPFDITNEEAIPNFVTKYARNLLIERDR